MCRRINLVFITRICYFFLNDSRSKLLKTLIVILDVEKVSMVLHILLYTYFVHRILLLVV